jgi:hypothetical protein
VNQIGMNCIDGPLPLGSTRSTAGGCATEFAFPVTVATVVLDHGRFARAEPAPVVRLHVRLAESYSGSCTLG